MRKLLAQCVVSIVFLSGFAGWSQVAISVRAGLIHYAEGEVFVGGQPFQHRPMELRHLSPQHRLQTRDGRAEILLAPTSFLWVGENSEVGLLSGGIDNVEVLVGQGSVIAEVIKRRGGSPLTLWLGCTRLELTKNGTYRVDYDAGVARVGVREGRARVLTAYQTQHLGNGMCIRIDSSGNLSPCPTRTDGTDPLERWSQERSTRILELNRAAARGTPWYDLGWLRSRMPFDAEQGF